MFYISSHLLLLSFGYQDYYAKKESTGVTKKRKYSKKRSRDKDIVIINRNVNEETSSETGPRSNSGTYDRPYESEIDRDQIYQMLGAINQRLDVIERKLDRQLGSHYY
jgi:hypothetical protein